MAEKPVLRGEVGCACVAREVSVERGGMGEREWYFLTSARHMTSGRVVEAHRTFQDHTLGAFSSLMALRYGGSDVGVVLLLHCFHAVSFPSHHRKPTQPKFGTDIS